MDPYQPSPQFTPPPATPAPQPESFPLYGSQQPQQQSGTPYPQHPQQPQQPAAHHSSLGTAPAPQPAATPPSSWYTPPPSQASTKPGDVNTYLRTSGATPPAAGGATGQTVGGQYSIDYLDQLAGPTSKGVDKKFIIIGVAAALALLVAAALLFASPQSSVSTKSEVSLYTTMVDVEASTRQSNRHIKNSQLAAINSNFRTSLTNATRDMSDPLSSMGQDPSSLKSAATKEPYHDDKLVATLEDARLNGVYDRIYANEINTKVLFILTYMESIEKNNSRDSMQEFIKNNQPSFTKIQQSIEDYRDSPDANLY